MTAALSLDAAAAADHAGVRIVSLTTMAQLQHADAVLQEIWRSDPPIGSPMPVAIMRALEHSGSYVHAAYDLADDRMLGVTIGFFGPPAERTLHSHITGALPSAHRPGIGTALKLHQREWCLERGVQAMTWTFDPLIARNAYFNVAKLGVRVEEYLEDFYGVMEDEINGRAPSDRVLVRWSLQAPQPRRPVAPPRRLLTEDGSGEPVATEGGEGPASIAVPADIEGMRRTHPARAARWRDAVRAAFARADAEGLVIDGFVRDAGYTFH